VSKRAERLAKKRKEWDLANKVWGPKSLRSVKKADCNEDKENRPLRRSTRSK